MPTQAPKYIHHLFFGGCIILLSILNNVPAGYYFASGDLFEVVDKQQAVHDFMFTWWNTHIMGGAGMPMSLVGHIPYYFLASLFRDIFGEEARYIFFNLFWAICSYTSCYYSSSVFNTSSQKSNFWRGALAFFYAFNVYTLDKWQYPGIFYILYPFIPALFASTYHYISGQRLISKSYFICLFSFLISCIAYNNPVYLISTGLFVSVFVVLIFALKEKGQAHRLIARTLFLLISVLMITLWAWLYQIPVLVNFASDIQAGVQNYDSGSWMYAQSPYLSDLLALRTDLTFSLERYGFALPLFGIVLFSGLCIPLFRRKTASYPYFTFLVLTILCLLATNKFKGILDKETIILLTDGNMLLSALRSAEKTMIFLPYFAITAFSFAFLNLQNVKLKAALCLLLTLSIYPILAGNVLSEKYGSIDDQKTYQNSTYAPIVRYPDAYSNAAQPLPHSTGKALAMPFGVINSYGWVNYPKIKIMGMDPTTQFFDFPIIHMNSENVINGFDFGKTWLNASKPTEDWFFNLTQRLNIHTFIYHKVVDDHFLTLSAPILKSYEQKNLIALIEDNPFFSVYQVSPNWTAPFISLATHITVWDKKVNELPYVLANQPHDQTFLLMSQLKSGQLERLKQNAYLDQDATLTTSKINATRYEITLDQLSDSTFMNMAEAYTQNFTLLLDKPDAPPSASDEWLPSPLTIINRLLAPQLASTFHFKSNAFGNSWLLDLNYLKEHYPTLVQQNANGTYKIQLSLQYLPQTFLYLGLYLSLSFVSLLFLFLLSTRLKTGKGALK